MRSRTVLRRMKIRRSENVERRLTLDRHRLICGSGLTVDRTTTEYERNDATRQVFVRASQPFNFHQNAGLFENLATHASIERLIKLPRVTLPHYSGAAKTEHTGPSKSSINDARPRENSFNRRHSTYSRLIVLHMESNASSAPVRVWSNRVQVIQVVANLRLVLVALRQD